MYKPLLARIINAPEPIVPAREPTGWDRVDRAIEKARSEMKSAKHEEDYQTIGLLCREILISLGQADYNPSVHTTPDGVTPSTTDAGRMIEAFITHTTPGDSNENVRRHVKAALKLALELQHKRTADFRAAALCLEATASTTNIVAILPGRRDRSVDSLHSLLVIISFPGDLKRSRVTQVLMPELNHRWMLRAGLMTIPGLSGKGDEKITGD
ncbi:MAG TPA: hypothetical protein PLO50_02635 [Nitrospira sp.]|nr:hypothetical protein [Nitrospira sp.]